jgi:pyruvate dehydrogenase E1 component alpha subunit
MYRLGAHTTVDDPDAYREESEVERWAAFDPIERYETFLRDRGLLTDDQIDSIQERVEDEIAAMIDDAEEIEPDPMEMFERPYDSPTPRVQEQREYLADLRERHGDDALTRDE